MTEPALTVAEAQALGAPTRRTILARLEDADGPVDVAELTQHLGLNHNAIRRHLARLVAAGMVIEERESRTTPGRPRLLYRLAPHGPVGAEPAYRRLAVLLATALATGDDPAVVGRAAAAANPAPAGDLEPVEALAARFGSEGFDPSVRRHDGRAEIVLGHCPFADAAIANREGVCRLHLGLAQGAADAIGGVAVDGLAPEDPRRAGCVLTVHDTGETSR